MTHQTDFMTVTQAARHLRVHRRSIDQYVARGRLHRDARTGHITTSEILLLDAVRAANDRTSSQATREKPIQRMVLEVNQRLEGQIHLGWLVGTEWDFPVDYEFARFN